MNKSEGLKVSGRIVLRSHPAGTIHLYETLKAMGKWDEARELMENGEAKVAQKNLIVDSSNYGLDILVQYLISAYTGVNPFPMGIQWGEIGTGICPAAAPTAATGASGILTGAYQ